MTVLRSREVSSTKTTPRNPKTRRLKLEPSTPSKTHDSPALQLPTPPTLSTSTPFPKPHKRNPNSDSNLKQGSVELGSGLFPVSGVMRRRSLRFASTSPDSDDAVAHDSTGELGFNLFGKRVTVTGAEEGTEALKMGAGEEEKGEVNEGERVFSDLRLNSGLGHFGANGNEEGKKKRKLGIDINLPAPESAGEDGGSKGCLSLRSGKKVAKVGELVIDLDAGDNGSVKSKGVIGRGEKGKGKLGESGSAFNLDDMVVLDSEDESIEGASENLKDGLNSRRRYSSEEKGKGKLVEEAALLNGNYEAELRLNSEVLSSLDNVVSSPIHLRENVALQDERLVNNVNARDNVNRGNEYMERFRDIARKNASRFAYFVPEEEEENHLSTEAEVAQDIEDWPGPFSTAMKIIKDRAAKQALFPLQTKQPLVNWIPKKDFIRPLSKNLIPSLQDLCLSVLAKNADAIVSLENVTDSLRHRLSQLLCDSRKMNSHLFELLVQGSPTEVRLRDCSWMTEEQFTKSFQQCETKNLTVLQLDQCGRCMPDYILNSTLAQSSNCLPALISLSVSGACRLSDVGLQALVSSAPALRSLNLSQCSLLTSSSIGTLADSLGSLLKELYLNDCQGIDPLLILPALKKFEHLEVLSLAGIDNVSDDFIREFVTACGYCLKELVLTDCAKLTDSSVKVIAEICSGLCALDLGNLYKLTDSTLGYLANGCRGIHTLKLCRNAFSDEAVSAFLETSGEGLVDFSLNNIKKVGYNTALSLAKHSRKLHTLDLSWCRNLTDEALGFIVDSCLSLRILRLFGCSQITSTFLDGYSNPEVRIIGLKVSPILEHVKVPDPHEGPLRYSSFFGL